MSRGFVRSAILARAFTLLILWIGFSPTAFAAIDGDTGTIRGVVLETRGGAPVDKVLVRLQDGGRAVTTDGATSIELEHR